MFAPSRDEKKYLRVKVRNIGHRTARKCKAHLKVIPNGGNPMRYPSTDSKPLPWGISLDFSDFEMERDIHPSIGEELLFVAFSVKWFKNIQALDAPQRYASIAVSDSVRSNIIRVEDSFTTDDFIVEVVATSEDAYCKAKLSITVKVDYQGLKMEKLSWYKWMKFRLHGLKR